MKDAKDFNFEKCRFIMSRLRVIALAMIIYWTQKLSDESELNISISFLQCEIFVETWQMLCLIQETDPRKDFLFPT